MATDHINLCLKTIERRFASKKEWLRFQLYKGEVFGLDTDKSYADGVINDAIEEASKWTLKQMLYIIIPIYRIMKDELTERNPQKPLPGIIS